MKKLSGIISALALVSALGVAPAFAQDHVIGGVTVSAEQLEAVKAKCAELNGTAATSLSDQQDASTTDNKSGSDTGTAGNIEVESMTLEQCVEGGFSKMN